MIWNSWKKGLLVGIIVQALGLVLAAGILDYSRIFKVLIVLYVVLDAGILTVLLVETCKRHKVGLAVLICVVASVLLFVLAHLLGDQLKTRPNSIELVR
jgi:hypothetical protein